MSQWWRQWDPLNVTVENADPDALPDDAWKVCVMQGVYFGEPDSDGSIGGRISAVFVIWVTSAVLTMFPLICKKFKRLHIPPLAYMIARMFGSGVIVTTAFVHLMDPAYGSIGPQSCVGMTGNWAPYSYCAAIMLASAVGVFLVDVYCEFFAESWFGYHAHSHGGDMQPHVAEPHVHTPNDEEARSSTDADGEKEVIDKFGEVVEDDRPEEVIKADYYSQFAGFLTLEFGVLFHSVMIGLNLGTTSDYGTLYVVLVFHQAFEGLGIGARMVEIPFPKNRWWLPWLLANIYGLTTPVCTGIGIGVRKSYMNNGYVTNVVSGVLDAISAGILFYTGLVELLARDFIFNPNRTKNVWYLNLQLFVFLWGAGLMALLGKWA